MPKIKVLPPELVSKIAAGEVVERPVSVVKELVENSLDAGAKNITVEIELGGAGLIRVTDDGCGMSAEDANTAVQRHATSKLEKFDDLYQMKTLGFRGEALPSIASVSQFSLQTRRPEDLAGVQLRLESGEWRVKEVGCSIGTQVTVRNLFYNVPARRKFLRSAMTEYNHILEMLESFGLLFPQVGMKLVSNEKLIFNWSSQTWSERCGGVIGAAFKDYLSVDCKSGFKMSGFLGKPVLARPQRSQHIFINKRVVSEFMIARAVKEAYGNLIAKDCFPAFILKFDLPPDKVDVNVHPRKTEVKIADAHHFYREVFRVVQNVIRGGPSAAPAAIVSNKTASFSSARWPSNQKVFHTAVRQSLDFYKNMSEVVIGQSAKEPFTVLGQLENSYILVLIKNAIVIFDQHAVSERLIYEDLKTSDSAKSQNLLSPITLELSLSEFNNFKEQQPALGQVGWQTEEFGERTVLVRSVPAALRHSQAKSVLTELLKDLTVSKSPDNLWTSMACHSAIRFGDSLRREEQIELVSKAFNHNVQSCPHGRPVSHKIELEDLHKIFKRRGFS